MTEEALMIAVKGWLFLGALLTFFNLFMTLSIARAIYGLKASRHTLEQALAETHQLRDISMRAQTSNHPVAFGNKGNPYL